MSDFITKEEVEAKVKKTFKNLKKRHKLDYLSIRQSLELSVKLQTEAGEKSLRKCINACVINSERLSKDAEVVSGPTKSALLELAFEEASKAYFICVVYLELFQVKNKPIWADNDELDYNHIHKGKEGKNDLISRFFQRVKLIQKRTEYMNILYSVFKDHDFKVLLPLMGTYTYYQISDFEEKLITILKRRKVSELEISDKMPLVREKIRKLREYQHIDYNKIKANGLYVNLHFKSLELHEPKAATNSELEQIKRNIGISLGCARSFLRALDESKD